jgi:hypothetical protein
MANGRSPGKRRDTGRDPGGFVAIPFSVLDSAAYMGLSPMAKALLIEVARQYHRDDNGRMLLSRAYLGGRGWYSAGAIQQAKAELIEAGLIHETVKGCRPNKASWYACTWRTLDKIEGYDMDTERAFERGAYRKIPPKEKRPPPSALVNAKLKKNAALIPTHGTESPPIVPVHGTESAPTVPAHGTIRPAFDPLPVPVHGHPLEVTISGALESCLDPASKGEDAGAPTCKHAGCSTLTLGRDYCRKHRHLESADAEAAR